MSVIKQSLLNFFSCFSVGYDIWLSHHTVCFQIEINTPVLSPYITGMRRVRVWFANQFAKPSRTVAKLSRNVRMVSQSPRMHRELVANGSPSFKHVILFCATKIIAKPSPSHRICREPVANPSPTLRRRSQTHRKEVSAICTMRQICNINKTISRLNCDK